MSERLAAYLRERMPAVRNLSVTGLQRKSGGASRETWAFAAQWIENEVRRSGEFILRRDPTASLLESDRSLEFAVLRAAHAHGIPVPCPHWLELDGQWLDRPFFIMDRVPGVAPVGTFPGGYPPELQERVTAQFVDILARIHQLDWRSLEIAGLEAPLPGIDAATQQLAHWRRIYEQDHLERHPVLEEAFIWLATHVPSTDVITLVHGDYRSGNYLFTEEGTITAMLDWEMAHLGDPMEDLGWACMSFWSGRGLAAGLTPRSDLLARYEAASGIRVDADRVFFYEVLGTAKMLVIALTGVRAYCEGRTRDVSLALVGFLMPRLHRDLAELLRL